MEAISNPFNNFFRLSAVITTGLHPNAVKLFDPLVLLDDPEDVDAGDALFEGSPSRRSRPIRSATA